MFRVRYFARVLVLVVFAFGGRVSAGAQNPPGTPTVIYPSASAVSSRLSDLRESDHSHRGERKETHAHRQVPPHGSGGGNHSDHDDALQTSIHRHLTVNQPPSFPGVGENGYIPPDPNIAVGPNHIVQAVNVEIGVFDKASGTMLAGYPKTLASVWAPLPGTCGTQNSGDPIAQYDALADRWVITQLGSLSAPYAECIAVSQTNDPTGAYNLYSYSFGSNLNDYTKLSVWPDPTNNAYLTTANLFANGSSFVGSALCAYDRAAMLSGSPSPAYICYTLANDASYLPSDLDGKTPPPANSPGYFLNFETLSTLRLYQMRPNFANPNSSTLTGPFDIAVNSFNTACGGGTCIQQPGTGQLVDSLGDRLMYRLAYRNFGDHEAMVANHSVANGSSVGVRWYELRGPFASGTPTVYQQGTFAPDTDFRWMGSIAMDKNGDIAVGYSVSSATTFPAVRITGRTPDTSIYPLGTLAPETTLQVGGGSQTGSNRWGDYTALRIDPSDDTTFWYTNEFYPTSSPASWSTFIGSFTLGPPTPDFTLSAAPGSLSVQQGQSVATSVTVGSLAGYNSPVSLSLSGCPTSGASCALSSQSATPGSAAVMLTVNTLTTASPGSYILTITGTSGNLTHTISVSLSVTAIPPTLNSIAVTPTSPSILAGTSIQFTATGTYSDNSTQNITASVTWTSSNTSVATISSNSGLASALAQGVTTITAASGQFSATATLSVTPVPPTLKSIAVTPANPSASVGTSAQFTATGTYSDNSKKDLTTSVTWTSSSTSVATITSKSGLASALAVGATTIKAALGAISGTTILTVTGGAGTTIHDATSSSRGQTNICSSPAIVASSDGGGTLSICNWQNGQGKPGTMTWKDANGRVLKQYLDLFTTHYATTREPYFVFTFNGGHDVSEQNGYYSGNGFLITGGVVYLN